ncbi:S8 family peptidase [Halobacillus sp. BAB-2008]|uniref:S8 family peptidase n=1 Tax=Halobacillus sp. BAB-2008 TaxID=1246484 RepID=UPI0002A4D57E|nr:S8 family peptidase [Halobacillus sp. BAB-2008]ELK46804.1 intracellular serine protease [Halobacillus sp. BAB-2008]
MVADEVKLLPITQETPVQIGEEVPMNIASIGSQAKWRKGYYGKGVVTAILDTGCDMNHPDLKDRIVSAYNFTEDHKGNVNIAEDLNGHGTHIAGTLAGSINKKGVVGVAPRSDLLILKVLNRNGGGNVDALVSGINYAVDWRGPDGERVRIISLSLGLKRSYKRLQEAIKRAVDNDIAVVAASGNDGDGSFETDEFRYPGAYEEVIQVGAVNNIENDVAFFSNTNDEVDLFAPGVGIYSTTLDGEYKKLTGTSMATPHVSGALALLIEEYEYVLLRKIHVDELRAILQEHTISFCAGDKYKVRSLQLDREYALEKKEEVTCE